jgi:hypothetical protein
MVTPAWFEHAAYGLGNRRSIQLSYGAVADCLPAPMRRGQSAA